LEFLSLSPFLKCIKDAPEPPATTSASICLNIYLRKEKRKRSKRKKERKKQRNREIRNLKLRCTAVTSTNTNLEGRWIELGNSKKILHMVP
jgi:predicted PhzF superfamily epimerase YddE/YHI9